MAIATSTAILIGAAVAGGAAAYSGYAQNEAAADQRKAQGEAKAAAQTQATAAEQATNRANQKKPDINAIMAAAQNASKTGGSSTMLTGPQGAAPSTLGSTSLLGG